jgi:hypothetical protein
VPGDRVPVGQLFSASAPPVPQNENESVGANLLTRLNVGRPCGIRTCDQRIKRSAKSITYSSPAQSNAIKSTTCRASTVGGDFGFSPVFTGKCPTSAPRNSTCGQAGSQSSVGTVMRAVFVGGRDRYRPAASCASTAPACVGIGWTGCGIPGVQSGRRRTSGRLDRTRMKYPLCGSPDGLGRAAAGRM